LDPTEDPVAFTALDDSQLAALEEIGSRRATSVGEYLYREGDPTYDFHVILSGEVEVVIGVDGENRIITRLGARHFLGELNLLTGAGKEDVLPCTGLFSFIGADPSSGWLSGCAAVDDRGFILTDRAITDHLLDDRWAVSGRQPLPFETSYPGLFAVGDVRSGRQNASQQQSARDPHP
jgi:CRP-like cAMP-binding protein